MTKQNTNLQINKFSFFKFCEKFVEKQKLPSLFLLEKIISIRE